jgi:hypothetical protein
MHSTSILLPAERRIVVAKRLLELPRDLVDPETRDQSCKTKLPHLAQLYARATLKLLEGPPKDVTVEVHRVTYNALAEGLKYHSLELDGIETLGIDNIVDAGLVHKHRLVRLSAG